MAVQTFHTLIARNRRNSAALIVVFMLLFVGMGMLIGWVWGGNWTFSIVVASIAAVISFFLMLGSYFGGSKAVLAISGAREIKKADDPQLFNVVDELSIAAGQPMPRIFVIKDTAPNAFATGRNPANAVVAITTGLRTKLKRDELQGVMAHEISHIRNHDILFAMLMAIMVGVLVMLCDVFRHSMWWGGGRRRKSSREGGGGLEIIFIIVALVLSIVAPILARVIQMSMSRQREYLADASAVALTRNPEGLAGALLKITNDKEVLEVANRATSHLYIAHPIKKFEDRSSRVFDTHPPIKERVKRLRSLTI